MSDTENPTGGQLPESDANAAFEASLDLIDPDEERQMADLGVADYAGLVDSEAEGAAEE